MKSKIGVLNILRGLAALYVVIGHARWLLWEGISSDDNHVSLYSTFEKISVYFLLLFRFGHQAVILFFVLSGFVIHYKYSINFKKYGSVNFNAIRYFKRRFFRIYTPLVFALFLTFILDNLGQSIGYNIYNGTTTSQLININVGHGKLNHEVFIGNLAFLTPYFFPIYGTNGPLWSLKFEWWFYMIFILFMGVYQVRRTWSYLFLLLGLIGFVANKFNTPFADILLYFPIWFFGVILVDMYVGNINFNIKWLSILVLTIPILIFFDSKLGPYKDFYWSFSFVGLISCSLLLRDAFTGNLYKYLNWLGDCSFTLYVIHFPIFCLLSGFLYNKYHGFPRTQVYIYLAIPIVLVIAYLLHFILEKPFMRTKEIKKNILL